MAYRRITDLRLKDEYCSKPLYEKCPIHEICYDNEFSCKYWKQIFVRPTEEGYTIRQGNSWYRSMSNDR